MSHTTNSMNCPVSESNISFSGNCISSDTGAMLPLDFIENNHLLDPLADLPFCDRRSRIKEHNSNFSLMRQYIFRLICGIPRQEDQFYLKEDPLLCRYFKHISSPSSICRLFKRAVEETVQALQTIISSMACLFIHLLMETVVLDIDSTKTDVYGSQERAGYIPHYSQVGYHPLLITEYVTRLVLFAWLRPGNTYSSLGAAEAVKSVLDRIPDRTPAGKKRTFMIRGDSAFYMNDLMTMLENRENPVLYAFRAKGTRKLKQLCLDVYHASAPEPDRFYTPFHPYYGETWYKMSHSRAWRRVCFKICFVEEEEEDRQSGMLTSVLKPVVFAVITNMNEPYSAQNVINFYCQRGNSENFTKELKDDFYARTLSHREFEANAFEFLLKVLAYNLFKMFQYQVMEGTDSQMQARSFRMKYQKTASKLSRHAGQWHLKIASSFRFGKEFLRYLHKSRTISCFSPG